MTSGWKCWRRKCVIGLRGHLTYKERVFRPKRFVLVRHGLCADIIVLHQNLKLQANLDQQDFFNLPDHEGFRISAFASEVSQTQKRGGNCFMMSVITY